MSRIMRMFDKWAEDEEDKLWTKIRELYGPLMELSLIFPSFRRDRLVYTFGVFFVFVLLFPVQLYAMTKCFNSFWGDFDLVSLVLQYWLLVIFALASVFFMSTRRDRFVNVHRCLTEDVATYRTGRMYSEDEPMKYEEEKRKQTIQFMFLPGLILAVGGMSTIVPYVMKLGGEVHYVKGANMKLPLPMCYHFPTHEGVPHVVALFGQLTAAVVVAVIIAALDFLYFRGVQAVIFEYRVLQYAVRTIFPRATALCKELRPDLNLRNMDIMNSEYQKFVSLCLKDCVAHHYRIQYMLSEFEKMMSLVTGLAVLVGMGVIGLSLINIVIAMESKNYENMAIFAMFSAGEILSLLLVTYFGETVSTEGEALRNCLYYIDWYDFNIYNRKLLLNFQVGVTEPVTLKGWGIAALNLETFSNIMNTAYSFFNLRLRSPVSNDV